MKAEPRRLSRPIRIVLRWQIVATTALTLAAGILAGAHGAVSAALGGAVSVCAGVASSIVAAKGEEKSAGGILVGALRAEGIKIGLIVLLLFLVLAMYKEVVVLAFLGSFVATVVIFSMAFFVQERE